MKRWQFLIEHFYKSTVSELSFESVLFFGKQELIPEQFTIPLTLNAISFLTDQYIIPSERAEKLKQSSERIIQREEPPAGVLTGPLRKPQVFHYAITQRLTRSKYLGEFTGTGPVSITLRDNAYTGADGIFMQAWMCVWPRQMREVARWEDGNALPCFPISSWLWRGSWGIVSAQKDYKSAAE